MKNTIDIATERLLLRPIQPQDAEAVFNYRSNKQVNQYQSFIPESLNEVDHFIAHKVCHEINVPGTWIQLVVIKKDDRHLIGDIGVHFHAYDPLHSEIGCTFNCIYHGQGYATEALKEIMNVLFYQWGKERISASVDPRNNPSIRLMERLGFTKEAHLKESYYIHGIWEDELIFAMLKENWNPITTGLSSEKS
ncbi:MAG TPA: GNAT family protein [Prolixibacteraceae bacterium]|nr:GNAT family protein [Prolixibacteraceae bacterium]